MVKAVCNSSPVIGLSIIGKLNILWELFDVIIPEEVYNEVVIQAKEGALGVDELKKAVLDGNINIFSILDKDLVNKAYGILHRGELEVVFGALETNRKVVIIDEKTARDFAVTLNLKPIGIIGVLKTAKQKGLISNIKPYLDKLIQHKYRISENLYIQTLQDVGEF